MKESTDTKSGQIFVFPDAGNDTYEFLLRKRNGDFEFRNETTRRKKILASDKFLSMRGDGRAVRVSSPDTCSAVSKTDIDPSALLPAEEAGITNRERERRISAGNRLTKARSKRFYSIRFDQSEFDVGLTEARLARFIRENTQDALAIGIAWHPSPSTLRRALQLGEPGYRPLAAFLNDGGGHSPNWDRKTLEFKKMMIDHYYSSSKITQGEAIIFFKKCLDDENLRRADECKSRLSRPNTETLRNWVKDAENFDNYARRYTLREAQRRFQGHKRAITAARILDYVVFDHTRVDAWAVVVDEYGETVLVERPWLTIAIDIRSRALLGVYLSFNPPSVDSVMRCLRQVVGRKNSLIKLYGHHKGATDCYGKPSFVIVDNGWEFFLSFQVACEAAGIDVIWAPIKTPEFKAYVEKCFDTLNEHIWHRIDGGIPLKPTDMAALDLKPMKEARFTLEQMERMIWDCIVTIMHVEPNAALRASPAQIWKRDIETFEQRPMIDDVRILDRFLGQTVTCVLTTAGIHVKGHRFHDPVVTTRLLDSLLRASKSREQRKAKLSTGKVIVQVTVKQSTCEFIEVWDFRRKVQERLPNWHPEYSKGLDFHTAKLVKKHADARNLAFHSEEEKTAARANFYASLKRELSNGEYRTTRKLARVIDHRKQISTPGDIVIEASVSPSVSGMDGGVICMGLPAFERTDDRVPARGVRRGGKKATQKAVQTRSRRRVQFELQEIHHQDTVVAPPANRTSALIPLEYLVEDPASLLAQLREKLK